MNKKKIRPLSTESAKKKPAKLHPKWWLVIIVAALVVFYLFLVRNNTIDEDNTTSSTSMESTAEQIDSTQEATEPAENVVNNASLIDNEDSSEITDSDIPDPKAILGAPLPETDSLAKEEIDRLEDERKRLAEQEKIAAEQVVMTKQLTELKAEEIELLEQQIAQLEAEQDVKTSAK